MMAKPRIRKSVELKTDTPDFLEALDSLASIFTPNIHRDPRRHLRFDLEAHSLLLVEKFLEEASQVQSALKEVSCLVSDLDQQCSQILQDLDLAENATTKFVQEFSALREQRRIAEDQAEKISAFLQRFQLSPSDAHLLQLDPGEAPSLAFFKALERVRTIRTECSELLSGQHQHAGLHIFETMAELQNQAQNRVFAWIQDECKRQVTCLDEEHKRILYAKAFAEFKLGSVPAYYSSGVDLCSLARKPEVVKKFTALIRIHVGGHDALRNVSEILTTLHEVVAEERDLFQFIFHTPVGYSKFQLEEEEEALHVLPLPLQVQQRCLEQAVGGLYVLVEKRLRQQLDLLVDPVSSFKAMQVVGFYVDTFKSFFPQEDIDNNHDASSCLSTLRVLKAEFLDHFLLVSRTRVAELSLSARSRTFPDLSASFEILELVRYLRDCLVASAGNEESTLHALAAFVPPSKLLIAQCQVHFSSPADACVFAINNLSALQAVLTLHAFTSESAEALQFEIGERIEELAKLRADVALAKTGLVQAFAALERKRTEQVKQAFDAFYRDLSTSLVMPEFDRIDAPRLRHQARSETCALILHAHHELFDLVMTQEHDGTPSFLPYTKAQVADLLDV